MPVQVLTSIDPPPARILRRNWRRRIDSRRSRRRRGSTGACADGEERGPFSAHPSRFASPPTRSTTTRAPVLLLTVTAAFSAWVVASSSAVLVAAAEPTALARGVEGGSEEEDAGRSSSRSLRHRDERDVFNVVENSVVGRVRGSRRLSYPSSHSLSSSSATAYTDPKTIKARTSSSSSALPQNGMKEGRIAWLMSFPNSGTSYTSYLVRQLSNTTTATNYGHECRPDPSDGKSAPVHDFSAEGPYWLHPPARPSAEDSGRVLEKSDNAAGNEGGEDSNASSEAEITDDAADVDYAEPKLRTKRRSFTPPPTPDGAYALTKTHCGGRCATCPPDRYLETLDSFQRWCRSGSRSVPYDGSGKDERGKNVRKKDVLKKGAYRKQYVTYDTSLVAKAVHLVRNPFDNLVARFHLEQKERTKKHETMWLARYSNDAGGFRQWCADEDARYARDEWRVSWSDYGYDFLPRFFEGVSCHAEFFKHAQWHSLAAEVAKSQNLPVLVIYYEDYERDLGSTAEKLLSFLNLTRAETASPPEFFSGKNYDEYFTREERAAASELMRRVSSSEGLKRIERYFVELDWSVVAKETKSFAQVVKDT